MFKRPKASAEDTDKAAVEAEIDEIKGMATATSVDELKDGSWFTTLLQHALHTYTRQANAEYFFKKYPGLPADAIAARRIELAQRYAMIEGGLSATAYAAAVAATIGTAGGASPLTLPGAVTSFAVDLLYVTRLQLHLAWDLAVLYRHPIDIDDPEDLYDLLCVAFGIKVGEALRGALPRLAPEAVRQGIKVVAAGSRLAILKSLPVIGKHLLQRNLIKFGIPVVSVPLSMKLNHYQTGQVGAQARAIYRDKAAINEASADAARHLEAVPDLLLRAVWLVVQADGEIEAEESWLLKEIVEDVSKHETGASAVNEFQATINFDKEAFYRDIAAASPEIREVIFDLACAAAIVDHDLHAAELVVLKELAQHCEVKFDVAALKAHAKRGIS
jgi:hypothetical protein